MALDGGAAGARPAGERTGERRFALDADFERRGVWAGVEELVEQAYLDLVASGRRDIVDAHNYELHMALPRHRAALPLVYASLTDTASGVEKTRNFPLDRAYRIVHGLVGFILEWRATHAGTARWTVAVARFDRAQHLARRFFEELARRAAARGAPIAVETDAGAAADPAPRAPLSPEEVERREREIAVRGFEAMEENYPELLAHHRAAGNGLAAARVALKALCLYNHYGYYHESGGFADAVLPHFDALAADEEARWNYLGNIFQGLALIGRQDDAQRIIETLAEPHLTKPALRAKMCYLLSMIHLRYATTPDIGEAERRILEAAGHIDAAEREIDRDEFEFLKVFIDNGLAFLRVRQGRKAEALRLCREGFERLTRALGEERHRLHRSVLQYNTAQVYVLLGEADAALAHYATSIEMDPHYSEYYNESANILQRLERYEEALDTYGLAIRYSAPYPEVHFNRAICQVHLGELEDALASFALSIELNPAQPEAHALRAEALGALGRDAEALADLDRAIALDADAVAARVNRAVMRFNAADLDGALADMDHAVRLEAAEPGHYENRAQIHAAMGRADLHARDLGRAEALRAA